MIIEGSNMIHSQGPEGSGEIREYAFKNMHNSSRGQVLIVKHVLCVMRGNEHKRKPYINTSRVPD